MHRRRHRTAIEIPAELVVRTPRSTPTQLGHTSLVEAEPPLPPVRRKQAAPWTETVYVSPSGRIFLPAGFDFDQERPRALKAKKVRRQPPKPRPRPRRACVVLGVVSAHQIRMETRESAAPVASAPSRSRARQTRESVAVPVRTSAAPRSRARVPTRESWVIPPHLAAS